MPEQFACPQGHEWSAAEGASASPTCPVCGAGSVTTVNTVVSDRLPPLPREGSAPPAPSAPPGYVIEGVLGRGGMGVVYKARQLSLNRIVALKTLRSGAEADPQEEARFRSEAEAAANLQHPHIIQVFDVGSHDGRLFCAMEFVAGGTLAEKLAAGPMPPRDAAALVETLARAVHVAHEQHIVHRDLKPQNVLLTRDGTPKVADFGLAKRLDLPGQTSTGAVMGTPGYMAPEQAEGRPTAIGPWTDVWALGAILYELLTGRPPFRGETSFDVLIKVVQQEPVAPSQLDRRVPAALEAICLKCLRKPTAERYPTAAALAEDLRRFLADEPAPPASAPISARRSRGWIAAALLGAAVLIGGGYLTVHALRDGKPRDGSSGDPVGPAPGGPGSPTPATPNVAPASPEWAFFRINPIGGPDEKFDRIAFPTPTVGYAASRNAIYRTEDGGETWRPLELRDPGRVFVLHFTGANTGWLGTDKLRHTHDGGKTWSEIDLQTGGPLKAVTTLAVMGESILVGGTLGDGTLALFRTGPHGGEPKRLTPPPAYATWFLGGLSSVTDKVALATLFRGREPGGVLLRTEDAGETWSEVLKSPEDLYHVRVGADGHGWSVGSGGTLWRTADAGKSWTATAWPGGETSAGCLALGGAGRPALMPLMGGKVAFAADGRTWAVLDLGREDFGYSMPSAAVAGDRVFVLSADGRIARRLAP